MSATLLPFIMPENQNNVLTFRGNIWRLRCIWRKRKFTLNIEKINYNCLYLCFISEAQQVERSLSRCISVKRVYKTNIRKRTQSYVTEILEGAVIKT